MYVYALFQVEYMPVIVIRVLAFPYFNDAQLHWFLVYNIEFVLAFSTLVFLFSATVGHMLWLSAFEAQLIVHITFSLFRRERTSWFRVPAGGVEFHSSRVTVVLIVRPSVTVESPSFQSSLIQSIVYAYSKLDQSSHSAWSFFFGDFVLDTILEASIILGL
jgi:hypothetical protein